VTRKTDGFDNPDENDLLRLTALDKGFRHEGMTHSANLGAIQRHKDFFCTFFPSQPFLWILNRQPAGRFILIDDEQTLSFLGVGFQSVCR